MVSIHVAQGLSISRTFMLVTLFVPSTVLACVLPYNVVFLAQVAGYSAALVGRGLIKVGARERWTSAAYTFCLLNCAALVRAIRFVRRDTPCIRASLVGQ